MWTPSTRCPMQVVLALKDAACLSDFVETGTAQGDTSFMVCGHFRYVHTVEIHKEAHDLARKRLGHPRVKQYLGDSPEILPQILRFIKDSSSLALFWLDGHYSGGPTTIGKSECPVIEEIQMIRRASQKHCILVDDMQIFCTVGAEREAKMAGWSQKHSDWPHVDAIIAAAKAEGPCFCMVKEHILFIVPPEMEKVVLENV